jgi:hypothetical protein
MVAVLGGSIKIEPTVDGVPTEADAPTGRKSFRFDDGCLVFKGVAGTSSQGLVDELRSQGSEGMVEDIDIDLRDRRFSNKKPKTSAAGRNSDSVVCFAAKAWLSSDEWLGTTAIEDIAVSGLRSTR